MKLTIEISDAVLEEAKDFALREGTTVDALAESGMRQILQSQRENEVTEPQEAVVPVEPPLAADPPRRSFADNLDHIGAAFGDLDA